MPAKMHNKPAAATATPDAPGRKREARDVSLRGAYLFGAILALTLVAVIFSMRAVFWHFARVQPLGPQVTPFVATRELPPAPRLQPLPKQDLQETLQAERQLLDSYGWVDQDAGKVRIPIDRAMDLLLERGLPVRELQPRVPQPAGQDPQKSRKGP